MIIVIVSIGSDGLFKSVSLTMPKYDPAKTAPIPPVVIASPIGPVLNFGIKINENDIMKSMIKQINM